MGRLERIMRAERDRAVLERILALLLALAALADRAAGLPVLKRLQLLAMLGRGEAEARILIVEMASGSLAEATAGPTWAAGDAASLAASFRMLALALNGLLARAHERPPRPQALLSAGAPERKRCRLAFLALPPPDTS